MEKINCVASVPSVPKCGFICAICADLCRYLGQVKTLYINRSSLLAQMAQILRQVSEIFEFQ